jgi:hypothetical protein
MMQTAITDIHMSKTGKVSDKWSSYLAYYDKLFLEKRNDPINLLEIGIQNGGSLETWAKYFNNAQNIIGCDIDENCHQLTYDDPRIKLIVADCNSLYTYQQITKHCRDLDIVIDDGSHRSVDIINSFVTYFEIMKPGGVYVVEDTHTLYWQDWGGELTNGLNAYIFFKKLIDVVNHQFWEKEMLLEKYMSDFFHPSRVPSFITDGWIESVEFRNSIITIRKALRPTKNGLGERLVTGTKALVNRNVTDRHLDQKIE